MIDEEIGFLVDNVIGDLQIFSVYILLMNIGGYFWFIVIVCDFGIIGVDEVCDCMLMMFDIFIDFECNDVSGMYYNWYLLMMGEKLMIWFDFGDFVYFFFSMVDNGWFVVVLCIVCEVEFVFVEQVDVFYDLMDFVLFFDLVGVVGFFVGMNCGGFWEQVLLDCSVVVLMYNGFGVIVYYICYYYDMIVSESCIVIYLGIVNGQFLVIVLFGMYCIMFFGCDWVWQEQFLLGEYCMYDGFQVWEGVYSYDGMFFVFSWGGSMFELLMFDFFVFEIKWGLKLWWLNYLIMVVVQKQYGFEEVGYGYWGFFLVSNLFGGYVEYGVDIVGMWFDGYIFDVEKIDVDIDWLGCVEGMNFDFVFGDGVVILYVVFFVLLYDCKGVLSNFEGIESEFGVYGLGGFYDVVVVCSGMIVECYFFFDQLMIMVVIGNEFMKDKFKDYFVD